MMTFHKRLPAAGACIIRGLDQPRLSIRAMELKIGTIMKKVKRWTKASTTENCE